jgi:hypothetical protein
MFAPKHFTPARPSAAAGTLARPRRGHKDVRRSAREGQEASPRGG